MTAAGLCDTCTRAQIVTSSKGSSFVFCRQSEIDPAFPKYPRLPVVACDAYLSRTPQTEPS